MPTSERDRAREEGRAREREEGRARERALFAQRAGWGDAGERRLVGDASFRRYYRLSRPRQSAIVMDVPAGEDVTPFVRLSRHLVTLGLSAPEIYAEDADAGFLLIEDLGDDTYTRVLAAGGDEGELYGRATDVLVALHRAGARALLPGLPVYAGEALIEATMLLGEWYVPAATGAALPADELERYRAAWRAVLAGVPGLGDTMLLRDYHRGNLMWLPHRPGAKACGVLDFQDAQRGHPAYDLVSLVEDARHDVSPAVHAACLDRYLGETGLSDRSGFKAGFAVMAAQRHARIIGLFVRLMQRDGKPDYLPFLPRVWRQLEQALEHEALQPLRTWVDRVLPRNLRRVGAA